MERTYLLTDEEKSNFHRDEIRVEIRQRAAAQQLSTDTIHIVDSSGDVWDTVSGSIVSDEQWDEAEPLTPEQIEENERLEVEARRLAEQIRPLAIKQLRSEAREEWRAQLRAQADEILKLRAQLARFEKTESRLENQSRTRLVLAQAEIARLKIRLSNLEKNRQPSSAAATDATASEVEEISS